MKQSLMLYLLILLALTNLFTYMFLNSQVKFEQKNYDDLDKKMSDSLNILLVKNADADYFSLAQNDRAQAYFENQSTGEYLPQEQLIPYIKDKLIDFNSASNGNPYTGQDPIDGKKFIINSSKILNHRWIIADFNNGAMWGEALIKYFVNEDRSLSFENVTSVLYPENNQ